MAPHPSPGAPGRAPVIDPHVSRLGHAHRLGPGRSRVLHMGAWERAGAGVAIAGQGSARLSRWRAGGASFRDAAGQLVASGRFHSVGASGTGSYPGVWSRSWRRSEQQQAERQQRHQASQEIGLHLDRKSTLLVIRLQMQQVAHLTALAMQSRG